MSHAYTLNDLILSVSERQNTQAQTRERIKQIIESGVDINGKTEVGCTPLMFAVMPDDYGDHNSPESTLDTVHLLIDLGADVNQIDSFGMKAKDYAGQLLDPNWKDSFGYPIATVWSSEDRVIIAKILDLL